MSSFAEMMAAKKAARLAAEENKVDEPSTEESKVEEAPSEAVQATEASIDWSKLSFQEKVALRKQGILPPSPSTASITQQTTNKEPEGQTPNGEEVSKPLSEDVGKVILLANEATKVEESRVSEGELLSNDVPDSVHIIRRKIQDIQSLDGVSLRTEMDELRKLLQVNPQACMYLLPEDLGLMVRQLRKITDNKVAQVMGATKATTRKKGEDTKLTAEQMQAAFDDL